MKNACFKWKFVSLFVVFFTVAMGFSGAFASSKSVQTKQVSIDIKGMTCGGCVGSVNLALKAIKGVVSVKVTLKPGRAVIQFDPKKTNVNVFLAVIKKSGYVPTLQTKQQPTSRSTKTVAKKRVAPKAAKAQIHIKGMTCGGCVSNLTKAFKKLKGVVSVKVSLKPQLAVIEYDPKQVNLVQLKQAVKKAGYIVVQK